MAAKKKKKPIQELESEVETVEPETVDIHIDGRKMDWEDNHSKIAIGFIEFLKENLRRPTVTELAEQTGFAYNTINSHLRILAKTEFSERWESFKMLSESILLNQFKIAMSSGKGATAAAKFFFQIVENWKPGMKIELEINDNLASMTTDDLIQRQKRNAGIIDKKLLRFARSDKVGGRTGSN